MTIAHKLAPFALVIATSASGATAPPPLTLHDLDWQRSGDRELAATVAVHSPSDVVRLAASDVHHLMLTHDITTPALGRVELEFRAGGEVIRRAVFSGPAGSVMTFLLTTGTDDGAAADSDPEDRPVVEVDVRLRFASSHSRFDISGDGVTTALDVQILAEYLAARGADDQPAPALPSTSPSPDESPPPVPSDQPLPSTRPDPDQCDAEDVLAGYMGAGIALRPDLRGEPPIELCCPDRSAAMDVNLDGRLDADDIIALIQRLR